MIDETFLRGVGLIVIAAAAFTLVARTARLPSIIAFLLAGLALGPATGAVQLTDALRNISEMGIVLLLFLVGLELSFDKIRDVGKAAFLAGIVQVAVTAVLAAGLCLLLGFPMIEAGFLAAALTLSSTIVVVKLLDEKKEFSSLYGQISVGILLVQDMAVIILLTLLHGLSRGGAMDGAAVGAGLFQALGGMAALLVGVAAAGRWLLPRPFDWAARSPQTLFIWSLCWCFLVLLAAHALHLSKETGAFLAGLTLAQLPYNQELHRRVHPLMNFFVAVFFVSLGIEMNPAAALAQWRTVLILSAFVLIGKFGILVLVARWLRFDAKTAFLTGSALSQISEFSFILTALGASAGFVSAGVVAVVGGVGLVTIAISACLILYNHRILDALARRIPRLAGDGSDREAAPTEAHKDHVIIVGMNTLGREIARRLHAAGEAVLLIDTDPRKLAGLEGGRLLGNVEYLSVLEEAGLSRARLLVSALQIEDTNNLLAFRCKEAGVPCAIHGIDLSVVDDLLEMDAAYLMIPKVDGIKLQTHALEEMGLLKQKGEPA